MPSLAPLVLVRFLAGAGAAAVIPLAIAWIGDVVAYERRQALLARYISGQILGIVFGQAAGGFFGELIGWRATLLMLGVLHIGAGLLLLKKLAAAQHRRQFAGQTALGRRGIRDLPRPAPTLGAGRAD
jgi:MFS transporter, YNFM family, putative membrane transport protein